MKRDPLFPCCIVLLLLGHLLLGIAHIAILPPWEGFDETGHYAYLQQIADISTLPRHGVARMSADVQQYRRFAPIPYRSEPPMEKNRGFTYKSFFEGPSEFVKRGRDYVRHRPDKPRRYSEGKGHNWESQHPPLYYLVLSPVYLATRHLSWGAQMFILRLTSYLFAWLALIVAVSASRSLIQSSSGTKDTRFCYWAMLGVVSWPVLFPSWFPEMARLGNDSLCALIMSGIWFITIRALNTRFSVKYSIMLGVLLGLGCLTKAFFLPVTLGVLGFWCVRLWRLERLDALRSFSVHFFSTCLIIGCIAGWWYTANWYRYGVPLGSNEMIALHNAGGLLEGLKKHFSTMAWLRGHAAFVTTLGWSGTWSLARPPYVYLAPMAFIAIFVAGSYILAIRRSEMTQTTWLPAWLILPVLLGFSYHVLVRIALTGEGRGTSGYYLHFMVAPLGVSLGIGFGAAWCRKSFRRISSILCLYTLAFSVAISWAQVLLFSGILFKAGSSKFYQFPDKLPPFLGLAGAIDRLEAIAFPNVGVVTWILGGILVFLGLMFSWKSAHRLVVEKGKNGFSAKD
ncbi:MAG: hypothetical protein JRJ47_14330 [Deltaproteobacteria bacterium]|nr:hypothetical protein [Deltaproteobacteria bacterium]